ncbi:hypothetical protein Tsubulata_031455 [Turnera subulata]|uniref:Pentacotripeptide-repeat region of PRORP domain-containing protein n=1 Tax=Turnera subulata TaxID=218843 RepID=A0A9Q0JE56_9ROSI|nr:hypothetical protein Tsubulata_031455 [Turnera subulata]
MGGGLSRNELQKLIRKLRRYNRYDHALQISQWMSDVKKEYQKIRVLIQEMDKRGFSWNRVTYQILLNASVASSNIQQMEKLLAHMETDFRAEINWYAYVIAATGYLKAGLVEKAVKMLKKSENFIESSSARFAYARLLNLYGAVGKKDEYLKGKGEEELAEELLKLVKERCNSSEAVFAKVEDYVDEDSLSSRALDQMLEDGNIVGAVPASSQLNDENGTES